MRMKMIKIKAAHVYKKRARNSRAIAKPAFIFLGNAEIDHFGFKLIVHVLIRGSLVGSAREQLHLPIRIIADLDNYVLND